MFCSSLILTQIFISRKQGGIFSIGEGSHSALFCETNPWSLLMGKRDAAMEDNVGVFSLVIFDF